jgi:hypothetical protein
MFAVPVVPLPRNVRVQDPVVPEVHELVDVVFDVTLKVPREAVTLTTVFSSVAPFASRGKNVSVEDVVPSDVTVATLDVMAI